MQLDQSEGTKEIQWKAKVLERSTTSNRIGCQTCQCEPGYSPKPRSKDNDQKVRERLTVWEDFLKRGENVKQGWLLSQLRRIKETYLTIEAKTSWWPGSAHWLSSTGQAELQKSILVGLTCSQRIVCGKIMYQWKEVVINGAVWELTVLSKEELQDNMALPWFKTFGWTSEDLVLAWPLFSDLF